MMSSAVEPFLRLVDIFVELVQIGQREPHVVFLDVHQVVIARVQAHHAEELVLRLVVAAIDMRVVHAKAAHAHQSRQAARGFVAVILPVFGERIGNSR